MRKNDEEHLLAEYIARNKDKLGEVLGIRINNLNLIENRESKRVELRGEGDAGERIFIKLQLKEDDYSDFIIEVQDIIVCAELEKDNKVVCIAINLYEEIIEELMQDAIFFREKQIELVFLAVNKNVMKRLKEMMANGEEEKGEENLKILKTIFLEKRGMKVYNEKY